ncbi:MAG: hypothetical protein ABWZ53_01485 [Actinomycetota bacterium]|jgi:hypothetical protein
MSHQPSSGAVGWTMFAGVMLMLIGAFHAIAGLSGIIKDDFYAVTPNYVFEFDATTWGWTHLIGGIIVLFAGFGVFRGAVWARTVGVIIAAVSALVSFAWIPVYPIWSIVVIAIDVTVIWALTAHGRDITMVE